MTASFLSRLSPRALAGVAFVVVVGSAALTLAVLYSRAVDEKTFVKNGDGGCFRFCH